MAGNPNTDLSELIPGSMLAQQYGCSCDEDTYQREELIDINCPLHGLLSDEGEPYRKDTA